MSNSSNQNKSRIRNWAIIGLVIGALVYLLFPSDNSVSALPMVNMINVINIWIPPVIFGCVTAIIGYIVTDPSLTKVEKDRVWVIIILTFFTVFFWWAFEQAGGSMTIFSKDYTNRSLSGNGALLFNLVNALLTLGALAVITWVLLKLFKITFSEVPLANTILGISFVLIWGIVIWMLWREFQAENTEVQASWFSILNSFFIISMAPLVSKFWNLKIITSGAIKFALGLILVGLGFAFLAWGSSGIEQGAATASVSMIWLVLAYYFHSMGELCVSPVGLSYVSKLAPVRLVGLMFGVWFIANFIANWSAGKTGSFIDRISETYSISTFFLIFTLIPIGAGLVLFVLNPMMKRMMHGYE